MHDHDKLHALMTMIVIGVPLVLIALALGAILWVAI